MHDSEDIDSFSFANLKSRALRDITAGSIAKSFRKGGCKGGPIASSVSVLIRSGTTCSAQQPLVNTSTLVDTRGWSATQTLSQGLEQGRKPLPLSGFLETAILGGKLLNSCQPPPLFSHGLIDTILLPPYANLSLSPLWRRRFLFTRTAFSVRRLNVSDFSTLCFTVYYIFTR